MTPHPLQLFIHENVSLRLSGLNWNMQFKSPIRLECVEIQVRRRTMFYCVNQNEVQKTLVCQKLNKIKVIVANFVSTRWHPHVRRAGAVWVGVCARGGHLLHGAHPHRAADGGAHHPHLALADGGGRVLQPGLLPRLAGLPQRVLRYVLHLAAWRLPQPNIRNLGGIVSFSPLSVSAAEFSQNTSHYVPGAQEPVVENQITFCSLKQMLEVPRQMIKIGKEKQKNNWHVRTESFKIIIMMMIIKKFLCKSLFKTVTMC